MNPTTTTSHKYLRTEPLHAPEYRNALLLPLKFFDEIAYGGAITEDGIPIQQTAWFEQDIEHLHYTYNETDIEYIDKAIFIGHILNVWGHILTDSVKKLWFLSTLQYRELCAQNYTIIYTVRDNEPLADYHKKILQLAGLDTSRCQQITRPTHIQTLVVPDSDIVFINHTLRLYHKEYKSTIDLILANALKLQVPSITPFPKKIYFTRTHLHQRYRDWGETAIERVFRKAGYTIIAPEEHSVEEQLTMLQHCTHFAATEGSVSHNSIFCRPGCHVTILRKANYENPYQNLINSLRQYSYTYISAHHSVCNDKLALWKGPFYLYPTRQLLQHLHIKSLYTPYFLRRSFWQYCKANKFWSHLFYKIWRQIFSPPIWAIRCYINPKLKERG